MHSAESPWLLLKKIPCRWMEEMALILIIYNKARKRIPLFMNRHYGEKICSWFSSIFFIVLYIFFNDILWPFLSLFNGCKTHFTIFQLRVEFSWAILKLNLYLLSVSISENGCVLNLFQNRGESGSMACSKHATKDK